MGGGFVPKSLSYNYQAVLRASAGGFSAHREVRPAQALFLGRPAGAESLSVQKLCGLKVESMASLAREALKKRGGCSCCMSNVSLARLRSHTSAALSETKALREQKAMWGKGRPHRARIRGLESGG